MSRIDELRARINRADEKRLHWIKRVQNARTMKEFSRAMVQWNAWFNVTMWNMNELDREEKGRKTMGDMSAETFFVMQAEDGSLLVEAFARDCTMCRFFTSVSRAIAFSDCSGADVVKIVCRGIEYIYDGWKPGELYTYHGAHDASVKWEGCFPEFNH